MTHRIISYLLIPISLFCGISCSEKLDDKEIIDFFTEELTERGIEPFNCYSTQAAVIWNDGIFDDWDSEMKAMNVNVISKQTEYGKKRILAVGYPLTEMVLYQTILNERYVANIDKILSHVVSAVNKKSGISFKSHDGIHVGENAWVRITIGVHSQDSSCIVVEVNNITVERENDFSGSWL